MDLKLLEESPPWDWPPETDKTLLRVLTSDAASEADQVLAAELAGDSSVISDELADALLLLVESGRSSEAARGQAAISLGPVLEQAYIDDFEDPEAVPITEPEFHKIQETLRRVYENRETPGAVRRSCLEASVRAPQDWHRNAVLSAYSSGDEDWTATAIFCMRYIRGFDEQILGALSSGNPNVHYHAVVAAGNWGLEDAWPHVADLLVSKDTEKPLLLAVIDTAAAIRPEEAADLFFDLMASNDEDVIDAVNEALALVGPPWIDDEAEEDGYDFEDHEEDDGRRH